MQGVQPEALTLLGNSGAALGWRMLLLEHGFLARSGQGMVLSLVVEGEKVLELLPGTALGTALPRTQLRVSPYQPSALLWPL